MPSKDKRSVSGFLAKKLKVQSNSDYDYIEENDKRIKTSNQSESKSLGAREPSAQKSEINKSRTVSGASKAAELTKRNNAEITQEHFNGQDVIISDKNEIPSSCESDDVSSRTKTLEISMTLPEEKNETPMAPGEDEIFSPKKTVDEKKIYKSFDKTVRIPISFLTAIKKGFLSQRELQVVITIFENSEFKFDYPTSISYASLSNQSGIHPPHIPKVLNSLIEKGVITRVKNSTSGQNQYIVASENK